MCWSMLSIWRHVSCVPRCACCERSDADTCGCQRWLPAVVASGGCQRHASGEHVHISRRRFASKSSRARSAQCANGVHNMRGIWETCRRAVSAVVGALGQAAQAHRIMHVHQLYFSEYQGGARMRSAVNPYRTRIRIQIAQLSAKGQKKTGRIRFRQR